MDGLSELRTTSWTLTQVGFEGCGTFCTFCRKRGSNSHLLSLCLCAQTWQTDIYRHCDGHKHIYRRFHVAGVVHGWAWACLALVWTPVTPRHFAWQAWHKLTSTVILRGRRAAALGGALGLFFSLVWPITLLGSVLTWVVRLALVRVCECVPSRLVQLNFKERLFGFIHQERFHWLPHLCCDKIARLKPLWEEASVDASRTNLFLFDDLPFSYESKAFHAEFQICLPYSSYPNVRTRQPSSRQLINSLISACNQRVERPGESQEASDGKKISQRQDRASERYRPQLCLSGNCGWLTILARYTYTCIRTYLHTYIHTCI